MGLQAADFLSNGGFSVERRGFKEGDLLDIPKEATLEVARTVSRLRSPVYRLPLDRAVLTELKESLVFLSNNPEALGQYRRAARTIAKPLGSASSKKRQP